VKTIVALVVTSLCTSALHASAGQLAASTSRAAVAVRTIDAVAVPVNGVPIRVDGDLSDEMWQSVPALGGFLQREPTEGAPTTHATDVRVAYDASALYVAVRAHDPEPDRVVGLLTRRDDLSPSDWVAILVDSFNDKRTAYEFGVNAAGVKYDRYWYNDTNSDQGWDAVWDVATMRTPEGWQAEFRIAFSQLRFRGGAASSLGFAATRTVAHLDETSTWPLLARSASGYVSSFGELRGVVVGAATKKFELVPYTLGQLNTKPVADGHPFVSSPSSDFSAGVDVKYQVAPGFTLTGTVNPDFGQVEADPAVVNLGAFETFFSERRPFFVEGSGNFEFNNLFYSRRIGRTPQRQAGAPDDGFADQPTNTTIVGAAKLTGRAGAFSIGALNAVTAPEHARLSSGDRLTQSRTPVEPLTSYSVVRASREFASQSRLGLMLTSTNRSLADELRFIPSSAVTGGIDGDLRMLGGDYSLRGFWAGSHVRGSAAAIDRIQRSNVHSFQRPDATHLKYDPTRTALNGHSGSLSFNKIGGVRTVFNANTGFRSAGYDVNDLGFQSRADEAWQENWIQFKDETPGKYFRTFRYNINQWSGWNFGGDRRNLGFNTNAHWRLLNSWAFGTGITNNRDGFDDRLTRGGPGGISTGNVNGWAYIETDDRRLVSLYFEQGWMTDRQGSHDSSQWIRGTIRPASSLTIGLEFELSRRRTNNQWVTNLVTDSGTHYVFGAIDRTTLALGTRVNYTLGPTLSLQIYARPFVSSGQYESFSELVAPRAASLADRYAPFAYDGNPDFNVHSFRTTNVLRWEYRPGSTLFVVWQQGRDGFESQGDFALRRDVGRTFHVPAQNAFLIKVSRWLNF
jgi:hypothetical protein